MKIVFLDIDGVLNNSGYGEDVYYDKYENTALAVDAGNLLNLKSILDSVPDACIVWSTDWRLCDDKTWRGRWLNPRLYVEGLPWVYGRIAGSTPKRMSSEHFNEIKWWLDDHPDIHDYVVIDDAYFPDDWFGIEKHLVLCDHQVGLTSSGAKTAIKILNGPL